MKQSSANLIRQLLLADFRSELSVSRAILVLWAYRARSSRRATDAANTFCSDSGGTPAAISVQTINLADSHEELLSRLMRLQFGNVSRETVIFRLIALVTLDAAFKRGLRGKVNERC